MYLEMLNFDDTMFFLVFVRQPHPQTLPTCPHDLSLLCISTILPLVSFLPLAPSSKMADKSVYYMFSRHLPYLEESKCYLTYSPTTKLRQFYRTMTTQPIDRFPGLPQGTQRERSLYSHFSRGGSTLPFHSIVAGLNYSGERSHLASSTSCTSDPPSRMPTDSLSISTLSPSSAHIFSIPLTLYPTYSHHPPEIHLISMFSSHSVSSQNVSLQYNSLNLS